MMEWEDLRRSELLLEIAYTVQANESVFPLFVDVFPTMDFLSGP
jgi:hypothetical protein